MKKWQASLDRWSHDRFDESEQAPKSRTELVSSYGYDIRNEDGPPKARRRRRYGRGATKYSWNWKDENARNKPNSNRHSPENHHVQRISPNWRAANEINKCVGPEQIGRESTAEVI
jgi:hypothetical protein